MGGKEAGQRRAGWACTHDQEVGFDDVGVGHLGQENGGVWMGVWINSVPKP
jgi:hypothetical protein